MREDPNGIPNNLLSFISQVAIGRLPQLSIFGNDYSTPDGTGVRDYIHVVDLAIGHIKAIERIKRERGVLTYNLGTGQGYSVPEMIKAFELASGKNITYQIVAHRPGNIAECWADPAYAAEDLGWKAEHTLQDTWRWQSKNPNCYKA